MSKIYALQLTDVTDIDSGQIGGKAANLAKLLQAQIPVPSGIAVRLDSFDDEGNLKATAKQQILQLINNTKLYAVRSSALAEDAEDASWAGQFESFLNTPYEDVVSKVEECHRSAKKRAQSYAEDKNSTKFDVAVVVQEMLKSEYAGVLFTRDPVSGEDLLVTEYVPGLGEELVGGKVDPKRVVLSSDEAKQVPFDVAQLSGLARKVEQLFASPQDIEWVWVESKMWLVQARPITVKQEIGAGYYLGEPDDLFYWGPASAKPEYMSDFMVAAERFFVSMYKTPELPSPPKTLVLFVKGKNVWLLNAKAFADFSEKTFEIYRKLDRLNDDYAGWQKAASELGDLTGSALKERLIDAWVYTEFAEFSLYGAETALIKQLSRFDALTRQDVWGAFTIPDKPTFLTKIDAELASSQDPQAMAKKYPWIQDGYNGLSKDAVKYFEERLKVVGNQETVSQNLESKRKKLIQKLELMEDEIESLTFARKLAEFMDDRKAWMMQTRRFVTGSTGAIKHGWLFNNGEASKIKQQDAEDLWQRYVDFKVSTSAVSGVVASNGGKHFVSGEIVVVANPTDVVENDKILVVPSTSPSYVPLMRNAKALITDHGGIMSHAAIVAREFNLPCIVGTKQATKVLKNGDKVVLDLVKGEVNR